MEDPTFAALIVERTFLRNTSIDTRKNFHSELTQLSNELNKLRATLTSMLFLQTDLKDTITPRQVAPLPNMAHAGDAGLLARRPSDATPAQASATAPADENNQNAQTNASQNPQPHT